MLYAVCLEYFIFFSIDSSEARKQYDEYCLSIMQTITYAHDRTHLQGTGWIVCTDRVIYLSEFHDHWWAKTIDEGGPLLSMSSINLVLLKENDK
jgi:hypothetical protein